MASTLRQRNRTRKGSVSSVEVAQLAGVSQATVSRVFSAATNVSPETRARVLAAARKLGYRPNAIARSLNQQSTRIIGIVLIRFMNPFYARLLQEFTSRLQGLGYWTLLLNVQNGAELEEVLPMALQYQVDGIIITSALLSSQLADECARLGTPVVLFNRYSLDTKVHAVCCDNVAGGRMVADALLDAGHSRIAYIAGEPGSSTNRDREMGFTERLNERGMSLYARAGGDYTYESGYQAAQELLRLQPPPDAIFCASDLMAMAAMDAARYEMNLRVPEDLSIIGFDDIPMAAWPNYQLTTVHQPIDRMVDVTLDVLLDAIGRVTEERIVRFISPSLIVRSSARLGNLLTD